MHATQRMRLRVHTIPRTKFDYFPKSIEKLVSVIDTRCIFLRYGINIKYYIDQTYLAGVHV
jgi:hypothetical protein